ncbi:MarR family winged helix-turn-helix transcriptional regulator [Tessaracoccus antarcticus]|uniref:MarR family transcriptional regulator n=1 Tax=Tessaracoccus antarcticus TaxID=2479848 RepID=A0A3M0G3R5_9ACTN|nr:MarR family winged helix-turn-helix transcriptional regulator [Tessaracoccus antarcticus]RMB59600.1 MarR family transcriptional regulator [Tessaracoccus antarcticus]
MSSSIPSENSEQVGRYTAVGSSVTRALRDLLRNYGDLQRHVADELKLGRNDVAALEHLIGNSGVGPAGLASLLGITTASATVLVDRLEEAGHVERRRHSHDRRRKQLVVTEHAQNAMFATLKPVFDMHRDIDTYYTQNEQAVIESYLRRVSEHYRAHVHGSAGEAIPKAPPVHH